MKNASGFTLLELMITLSVLAVLVSIAAPSFQGAIKRNSVQAEIRELRADLTLARSEATSKGVLVAVCGSDDLLTCNQSSTWTKGWIVFIDDGDGGTSSDIGDLDIKNTEEILRVHEIKAGYTIKGFDMDDDGVEGVGFNSRGYLAGVRRNSTNTDTKKLTFKMCEPNNDVEYARAVLLDLTGRAVESYDLSGNQIHEDVEGVDLSC